MIRTMILRDNPRVYAIMWKVPTSCGEAATPISFIDYEGVGGGSVARSVGEAVAKPL